MVREIMECGSHRAAPDEVASFHKAPPSALQKVSQVGGQLGYSAEGIKLT
jgi:hypothetical protein